MRINVVLAIFLIASGAAFAETVTVQFDHCHDGDTCRFILPTGRPERVRIVGLDAPEIGDRARCPAEHEAAVRALEKLNALLRQAQRIELQIKGRDKFKRMLAIVTADGNDVAPQLLSAGLARKYNKREHASPRGPWCPEG